MKTPINSERGRSEKMVK